MLWGCGDDKLQLLGATKLSQGIKKRVDQHPRYPFSTLEVTTSLQGLFYILLKLTCDDQIYAQTWRQVLHLNVILQPYPSASPPRPNSHVLCSPRVALFLSDMHNLMSWGFGFSVGLVSTVTIPSQRQILAASVSRTHYYDQC